MPRKRSEASIEAEKMYHDGMRPIDIAKKIGKPPGTVRRWKSEQGWDNKNERSEKEEIKANVRKPNREKRTRAVAEEVEQVINNPDLTDKQRLFCILYVKYRNKTKAYQKAYDTSWDTANSHAYKLWSNEGVRKEIERLLGEYRAEIDLDIKDLFQWYLDIARADINDFVEISKNEIKVKDKTKIDGVLISEIKEGQFGISVKLQDRLKAMEWLGQHIGLADEEQRARIEVLKAKAQEEKQEDDYENDPEDFLTIEELRKLAKENPL